MLIMYCGFHDLTSCDSLVLANVTFNGLQCVDCSKYETQEGTYMLYLQYQFYECAVITVFQGVTTQNQQTGTSTPAYIRISLSEVKVKHTFIIQV
jgi:hypothetical protein